MSSEPLTHTQLLDEAFVIIKHLKIEEKTKVFVTGELRPTALVELKKRCILVNSPKDADMIIVSGPVGIENFHSNSSLHRMISKTTQKKCAGYYVPNEMSKYFKNSSLPFKKVVFNATYHFFVGFLD